MKNTVPKITYNLNNPLGEKFGRIEVNGEMIHQIEDIDKFYEIFGFTSGSKEVGVLPEEFVWGEYINNHEFDFTACMQIQIIEYLRTHSKKFMQKYGDQCEKWLAALIEMRAARDDVCATCKSKSICSN